MKGWPSQKKKKQDKSKTSGSLRLKKSGVPAAKNVSVTVRAPRLRQDHKTAHVEHSELLVEAIAGSGAFESSGFDINPGLDTFPWLSKIANNYTKYKFEKLRFYYVPIKTNTDTPGRVYLAFDYDGDTGGGPDGDGLTKLAMLDAETHSSSSTWDCGELTADVKLAFDGIKWKRVRCGPMAGAALTFDPGSFVVATDGQDSTSNVGEIWCEYTALFKGTKSDVGIVPAPRNTFSAIQQSLSGAYTNGTIYSMLATAAGKTWITAWNTMSIGFPATGVLVMPCGIFHVHCSLVYYSDTIEATTMSLGWLKNGVVQIPTCTQAYTPVAASEQKSIELNYFVEFPPGGGTLEPTLTFTGAAGTCKSNAGMAYVHITCA